MKKLVLVALLLFTVTLILAASQHVKNAGVASSASATVDARGTPSQPLAVSVIPAPKSAEDRDKENYENDEKRNLDRGMTKYTGWVALLTAGLLVVAGAQVWLFFRQLEYMRQTLEDARRATVISQRAYVQFVRVRTDFDKNPTGNAAPRWLFYPEWTNKGHTPTAECRIYCDHAVFDEEMPEDHKFPHPTWASRYSPTRIYPDGTLPGGTRVIPGEAVDAALNKTKHLYIWGVAEYRTVFPEEPLFVTGFCVKVIGVTRESLRSPLAQRKPIALQYRTEGSKNNFST